MSLEMAFFVRLRHKQAEKMRPAVDQYMATTPRKLPPYAYLLSFAPRNPFDMLQRSHGLSVSPQICLNPYEHPVCRSDKMAKNGIFRQMAGDGGTVG